MLSNGLGASVLVFFGERGPVAKCGGCSEWSGVSRLGGRRDQEVALRIRGTGQEASDDQLSFNPTISDII
jgi:hypothetical protein